MGDHLELEPAGRRGAIRALVQDFSPMWFTWCMNAGAIAQLLHQSPYRFKGIDILAAILFCIDLVLYMIFSILFIARFAWFRWDAYREITGNIGDLTFVSCWAIALMTLTSGVTLVVSTASWGGYPFSIVAYVMWWYVTIWDIGNLLWTFIVLIRNFDAPPRRMPFSIIIPAVSVATTAVTGAVVASYAKDLSTQLAIPVIIVGFYCVGVGILLGLILYVYLLQLLLTEGWPAPELTMTMFILVGPMGQSASALQILGSAAATYHRFGDYNKGTFFTAQTAVALEAACALIALLFDGLGIVWLILTIWAVIERAYERKLAWAPSWNAAIFPNATLATSFLTFSIAMDSPALRVVTAIMTIALVIVFLVNIYFTVVRIWQGKLLIVRDDPRVTARSKEQEKQQ